MRKHISRGRRHISRRKFPVGWLLLGVTALLLTGHQPGPGPVAVAQSTVDCQPGDSRVACENRQTEGVAPPSEWDVAGAGDGTIQGFATDISVSRGGTVHFKVDSPVAAYRMRIYRLGYYGGQGARKLATIPAEIPLEPPASQPTLPLSDQPDCMVATDNSGLVDCGNWAETASWTVPTTAVSGIYIARLERADTAGASHVVFIVRDDVVDGTGQLVSAAQSNLLFQTSDTTWQAYNRYGGNSLYTGAPGTDPNRAYKVSYNRPFTTRGATPHDWLFDAEYPLVRWIERNGFDVSYVTGVDTDRMGAQLFATPLRHQVFLSVGHDEYWSGAQRTNVTGARNAGMHLAFFSGNEVFWKTRWENSIAPGAAPYRTLVSYKETHAGAKIDPLPNIWTGTWRDNDADNPQGSSPENSLTGQLFTANDSGADYPMKVPQADGLLRFWRNTTVAELAQGGEATLAPGTVGYEWDSDVDNGSRPAGLFRMSSTTLNVPVLVDQGSTYQAGTATHSITLYRHNNSALVFGAGTVQWSWGLDGQHDRGGAGGGPCTELACPGDVRMQQATLNLFADMGVQPTTLQSGLAAATATGDNVAPASLITFPAPGATLQVNLPLTITGSASDSLGLVAGIEVSTDGGATWHPAVGRETWLYSWTPTSPGTVNIKTRAVDDSGRLETPSAGVSVNVVSETVAPQVLAFEPAAGAFGVALDARVIAHFTEPMNATTISGATFDLRNPLGGLVTATVTYDAAKAKAVLRPSPPLQPSTTYTAKVTGGAAGVKDVNGNAMVADVTWSFTTGAAITGSITQGPGGPVLVVTSATNKFSTYYAEIMRAEGLNAFAVADIASVNAATLASYDVVILGEMALSAAQVTMFTDWVTAGGNLVAMRPDKQLYPLLGLTNTPGTTLADGYILINTTSGPGAGLVAETIQFHGVADRASLGAGSGAVSLATLYSTDTVSTTNPAVTHRSVGTQGGEATAFLYDLARSIVYTRQGNPAWNGQERDSQFPIRSDDLFYGALVSDPQPDYINLNKVAIPQADEQQRFLANVILHVNADRKPLPRFWYFPRGEKAVVVMTGDDHARGGTIPRFDQYKTFGPDGCSVSDWECVRSTSYVFPGGAIGYQPGQAAAFEADGFEIALHVNPGGDNTMTCGQWNATNLPTVYDSQLADFASAFPDLSAPVTNRTHCISWGQWVDQPKTELARGIRLDTNYYFWPDTWVQNRPGMFTGSGMPMRFADLDGTMVDVYQATSQMTDESAQTFPFTINALLDKAIGAQGYYGAFTANIHTDVHPMGESDSIVQSARDRGVPIVSAKQLLTWLDARNASTFSNVSWDGIEDLSFTISVAAGANGIEAMVPYRSGTRVLSRIMRDGAVIVSRVERIKGIDYVIFSAAPGAYVAEYPGDGTPPVISNINVTSASPSSAVVNWTTDEASTSEVMYGLSPTSLTSTVSDPALRTAHSMTLTGLSPGTAYYYRVRSTDSAGNSSSSLGDLSFTTSSLTLIDTTLAHFGAGTLGAGAYLSETVDGEVMLTPDFGTEFSGTSLPDGWETSQWTPGGIATVGGGVLTVDGVRVNPVAMFGPGRSLEFTATFSGQTFQHSGWGITFDDRPFAIFSTKDTSGQLWARSYSAGGGNIDQALPGILLGIPHRFRIDWNGSNVQYFVDGSIVATHNFDPAVTSMRPIAASDFTFGGGNITVNWLRMGPYPASATFTSRVFDAGDAAATWGALSWNAVIPPGTSIAMSVRAGGTPTPDASWTPFAPVAASGNSMNLAGRYLQYQAVLSTTDPQRSPELFDVTLGYAANAAPTAADDTYSTLENQALNVAAPGVLGNDADANNDPLTAQLVSTVSHGTLSLNPNGSFLYTPQSGFNGTDSFTYAAHDGVVASNTATVTITVISVNDAPVANGDSYSTPEDTPLTVSTPGVLGNDTDANGDPLTAAIAQQPLHGTVSLNADGSFIYTPAANFNGADSFSYTANDGEVDSNVATVNITVTAVNDPPQAVNDAYSVVEDNPLTVAAPGVLGNDSDADGTPLTATVTSGVAHGVLELAANGSFTYTPEANYNGPDSFTYSVSDGTASASATVAITVTSVNDSPVAVDDAYTTDEDVALSVPATGVLANDSDLDSGSLTAALVTGPASGTLVLNPNGAFVYTPEPQFNGTVSFTYRASDGNSNSNVATVTITVAAVNDAPAAGNDNYSTVEDTPLSIAAPGVLTNDSDIDSATLTAVLTGTPLNGTVVLNPDGSFLYTPNANFAGADSFTYRAFDGGVASPVATVTIAVQAVNDAPVAVNDAYSADKNVPLTIAAPGVMANDTDVDGPATSVAIESEPLHGTVALSADGGFTYTPALDYVGADTFSYRASDGTLSSAAATVSITVFSERLTVTGAAASSVVSTDTNDGEAGATTLDPVETSVTLSSTSSGDVSIGETGATQPDPAGYTLLNQQVNITAPIGTAANPLILTFTLDASVIPEGENANTLQIFRNGALVADCSPSAGISATPDPCVAQRTQLANGDAEFAVRTSAASIWGVARRNANTAAVAGNDSYSTNEDAALVVNAPGVLGNDTDADGNTLKAVLVSSTTRGTLTLDQNGGFTYTPETNYSGSDSFTYQARDGRELSNVATVTITVNAVNDPPVAADQSITTAEDTAASITLGATDLDGDALTYAIVSQPAHGTLTGTGANRTYTPDANYNGPDSFTFTANDSVADSNVATVSITVTAVADAPVANNQSVTTAEDTAAVITLTGSDADGDPLTYSIVTQPTHGTLSGTGATRTYTPAGNYNGPDSFTFTVNDGAGDSNVATVSITVTPVNDAPVANAQSITTAEDTAATITLTGSDVEGDALTYIIVTPPTRGTLSGTGATRTYTPELNYNGPDSFTFKVSDGTVDSANATVSINVTAVNDAPVAANQSVTTPEDTAASITLGGTDVDGGTLTFTIVTQPLHGTLTGTGANRTYTPALNYNGPDSFTFKVDDGTLDSNTATVSITVSAVNDAPIVTAQSIATDEDTAAVITLTGTDVDGDTLTFSVVSGPTNGTLTGTGATRTYTPAPNYNGPDSFTFKANDNVADSNVATVSITVNAVNDAPVATNQSISTPEDTAASITLGATDAEGSPLTFTIISGPSHGTLTGTGATRTYTPALNYNGSDSITFRVNDGTLDSNVATVSITVTAVNDAPTAASQSITTPEDTAAAIVLGANDADGDALTYIIVSGPTNGTLSGTGANRTYTPAPNYNGPDSFTFKVNDNTVDSNVATISIDVTAVNDAPTAAADSYSTNEDTVLTIAAPGVLGNDSDVEGQALTAVRVSGPSSGTLTLNANGSFTYTPNANFNGTDSFTYTANDASAASAPVAVTITVNAVNDAPQANDDSYPLDEDAVLTIAAPGVLANDADVDSQPISAELVSGPTNGTLTLNANGSFTYTPAANYFGVDAFTYKASDGTLQSALATVSLVINGVNDAPVAVADSATTSEDVPADIDVILNDSDLETPNTSLQVVTGSLSAVRGGTASLINGRTVRFTPAANANDGNTAGGFGFTYTMSDGTLTSSAAVTISVTAVNDAPSAGNDSYSTNEDTALNIAAPGVLGNDSDVEGSALTATLVTGPAHGTLTLNGNGSFTYMPANNYNGPDSFTYTAGDGTAQSTAATVTITVNPVNDAPAAVADSYSTPEDTPLNVSAPGVLGNDTDLDNDPLTAVPVTGPTKGTLTLNGNGSFTYTPNANVNGSDSFTYRASDGTLDSSVVTVSLTISAVNDAPVATGESYSTAEDTALTVSAPGVLSNDTDADNDGLTAVVAAGPTHGTLTLNANGSFTYTPAANYNGPDSFTYKASDGLAQSAEATVSITVTAVNDAPTAANDSYSTNEDTALNVAAPGVLGNDSDVEGATLTATLVTGVAHGTLTLNQDGSFSYTPASNYSGPDSFTYTAGDGTAQSTFATVSITVNPINDAPVANADSYSTAEDTALNVSAPGVVGNDTDADADTLTAVLVANPAHGTLTLNANGSFTYTPAANYSGPDSFTYRASDGTAQSAIATVAITVNAVNDAPVASNQSASTPEDTAASITLGATDAEGSPLTFSIVSGPTNGTLTGTGATRTYTPAANYNGADSFTFTANDGTLDSNVATVSITVTAVNDTPTAANQSVTTPEDAAAAITLGANDVDGDTLAFMIVSGPTNGTLSGTGANRTYTPASNYSGPDSFTFKVNDGTIDSNVATVSITVTAVNDAPSAANDSYSTNEDTALTIAAPGVLGNDTDVEGSALTAALGTGPVHGTVTLNANGSFTYTPAANYSGPDSFTYRADDGTAQSAAATVSITVNGANDAPSAVADSYTVTEDTPLTTAAPGVLANDTDPDGNPLTASVVTNPTKGTLTLNANGSFTYTPNANATGSDSFTYRASDGTLQSDAATVSLTINAVNDAPVAVNDSYTTPSGTALNVAAPGILGNDTDIDSGTLTAVLVAGPANGTLTLNANGSFTYTPNAGFSGTNSFTYRASDGSLQSGIATVTITVTQSNQAPVAVNDSYTTDEETALNVAAPGVKGNDTDANGDPLTVSLVANVTHGTLTLNADGSFAYTPAGNYNGADSFTYRASDGTLQSNIATVSITVAPVNDNPTAVDDSISVMQTAGATAVPVLANDSSVESGETLSITAVTQGTKGTVAITGGGTGLTYDPDGSSSGTDTFTYTIGDGNGGSATATVTVTVLATPTVSVNDASIVEGNSGTKDLIFDVTLSQAVVVPVTVNYATVNGFARAGVDYIQTSGTLTFAAGDTLKQVTVKIIGETTKEKNETFAVRLSSPTNATIVGGDGIGTILDDDATPTATTSSTSTKEGSPSSSMVASMSSMMAVSATEGVLTFTITLTNASEIPISVDYTTVDLTGKANTDFVPVSGTLTFAEDETVKTIDVSVIGNNLHQLNRQLKLQLSNPVELILGTLEAVGEIEDDDPAPAVVISDAAVIEGNSGTAGALFTVTLAEASGKSEMVNYATADGTATAGSDYTAVTGTLTFAPGEVTKTITVPVIGDTDIESNETFTLTLTRGSDAPIAKPQGIATITDDDVALQAWTTTTAAEFSTGSLVPGAVVTNTEGGELTLAAPTRFDMLGTALPTGWTGSIVKSGSFSVANGVLTADGATISSTLYGANTIVEFNATFAMGTTALVGVPNQFAGFTNGQFITKADGKLYARTSTMQGSFETPIPMPAYGVPQRFAIRWLSTGTDYFLNGVQVASHTGSAMMSQMPVRFGDSTALGAKMIVDWAAVGATTGSYVSRTYDATQPVAWTGAYITTQLPLPLSTSVTVMLRTSNDGVAWTAWTSPAAVALAAPSRYVQYRLDLTMTSPSEGAPIVKDVAINYEDR